MVSELRDRDIIRQVLNGDVEAFRHLVARHRARFARFAVHMLGDRDEAEDALQDAFVRAYRALASCRDPDRFDAWFFRILANRCRTRGGRRRREALIFVRDPVAVASATGDQPMAPSFAHDLPGRLAGALARLDAASREAFLLKHVEELSYIEMSRLTGAGVSALKMRVKRAGERLRRELEDADVTLD